MFSIEQCFANENRISLNSETIEINMNDVIMEEQFEKNLIVETKGSRNQKKETKILNEIKEVMKINIKKLHAQRKFWKFHGRTSLCWGFYCVNDNATIDLENAQTMHCILCHKNPIIATNPRTQARK
jgi:hypothetical protein